MSKTLTKQFPLGWNITATIIPSFFSSTCGDDSDALNDVPKAFIHHMPRDESFREFFADLWRLGEFPKFSTIGKIYPYTQAWSPQKARKNFSRNLMVAFPIFWGEGPQRCRDIGTSVGMITQPRARTVEQALRRQAFIYAPEFFSPRKENNQGSDMVNVENCPLSFCGMPLFYRVGLPYTYVQRRTERMIRKEAAEAIFERAEDGGRPREDNHSTGRCSWWERW